MRKLIVSNNVSLDGYFVDSNGDMTWANNSTPDAEFDAFVRQNAQSGGALLLGRVTYNLMVGFWPTPVAMEMMPIVAERMNNLPKVVFSRTLKTTAWNNVTLVNGDIAAAVQTMKNEPGEHIAILGSGSIVAQLAQEGLIDEYQILVVPVVLGAGRTLFEGITEKLPLKLIRTRAFGNGNVLLCYEPLA